MKTTGVRNTVNAEKKNKSWQELEGWKIMDFPKPMISRSLDDESNRKTFNVDFTSNLFEASVTQQTFAINNII